ncbi:helix-turn-helix transcriptional regulator [Phenylobacterium soli]|uniref:HTH cro/C1-type domain-containing protein n=1 Tax=Phenylobacterium soli TaxID=2170551 RepID=A0A328ALR0_9CAUL|nr:helix-turn-helix transcriptional regulator [Phenylobacterium soli]RAK55893.1 hypothetical protein DJ017_15955 [Phenylobacterium soli]
MNNVARYRAKAKLSQRALSAMVGVSQQTIQRIEAEAQTVRFETAMALAGALKVGPRTLFPEIGPPNRRGDHKPDETIDYSGCSHALKIRFAGGLAKYYSVNAATARRVRSALANGVQGFLAFDTDREAVVVNCGKLLWTTVLSDPGVDVEEHEAVGEAVLDCRLKLYFDGEPDAHEFEVEPDQVDIADDAAERDAELQWLLTTLEATGDDQEAMTFVDAEGEEVIFSPGRLTVLEAPLVAVRPKLLAAVMEGLGEDEAEGVRV